MKQSRFSQTEIFYTLQEGEYPGRELALRVQHHPTSQQPRTTSSGTQDPHTDSSIGLARR